MIINVDDKNFTVLQFRLTIIQFTRRNFLLEQSTLQTTFEDYREFGSRRQGSLVCIFIKPIVELEFPLLG